MELRVDANGAFSSADARQKLETLSRFCLHSIEQPIRAGQWKEMAALCADTPFPIALDEELIGVNDPARKAELLDTIRPQYIILKPSLHGGLHGAKEWIDLATGRGIGSWVTSALETNVGLNAIAQWTATLHPRMPQGLGTGHGAALHGQRRLSAAHRGRLPLVPERRTGTGFAELSAIMSHGYRQRYNI